ncbi:ATP-binding protein [Bifidobacterium sp. ESL0690]|uniref:ATP-binding protein n=1 Tax=Bifidobacterium sp. ESL0690 TaxID=2983214 RepID=UPI0023F7FF45|nr:ATP-binding protein [Bifidobacterium sp. ESL0690]WEV46905.1 ATP-binding protein [Bifidobacterium sp. ESL0690]
MDTVIAQKIQDFSLDDFRPIVPRDLDLGKPLTPKVGNLVKVVIGMRRSGKSYRLFQEMDRLLVSGVETERICYFNFEDDRLGKVTSATGDAVLDTFFLLHPQAQDGGVYLFFDELQEMENWGKWLRRVVDTMKATIYVSGSSSKMLSSEVSTEFRGRALDFELLPYSFREFVRAYGGLEGDSGEVGKTIGKAGFYSTQEQIYLRRAFAEYLDRGGFPAAQSLPMPQAIALLQGYVQRVVAGDVVERHNIGRPQVVVAFARRVLGSNGKSISLRKIENDLRSAGLDSSRALLSDVLKYFEEAYLLFALKEFSVSLSANTTARPKIYAVDPGLALAYSRASVSDVGQRLEQSVYLELRRRNVGLRRDGISSYRTKKQGYEVDFVVGDVLGHEAYELYQVTVSMDDEQTARRELRALWEVMDEQGMREATLIVLDGEAKDYRDGSHIVHQVPAWLWFADTAA